MRVLFAVDGSEGSFAAVRQIGPLLCPERDHIVVYYRPPDIELHGGSAGSDAVAAARQAVADCVVDATRKQFPGDFLAKPDTIFGHQDPRRGITLAAEQWNADLIAVGARGLGKFKRLLLGSVSRAVVHSTRIPVWVARPKKDAARSAFRVLIAAKGPETADVLVQLLSRFSWPDASSFTLVSVLQSMFAGQVPEWLQQQSRSPDVEEMVRRWVEEEEQESRDHLSSLQKVMEKFPRPLASASIDVVQGDPTTQILEAIARGQFDLVVLGTHNERPLLNTLLGSTAAAVLDHAECSVLIVPRREHP